MKKKKKCEIKPKLLIDRVNFFRFLKNNGFWRYYLNGKIPINIRIENNTIDEVTISQIRDFIFDFIRSVTDVGGGFTIEELEEVLASITANS